MVEHHDDDDDDEGTTGTFTTTTVPPPNRKLHVVVVVLGDLGRSPRMMYHTLSLLQGGHTVTFVGYQGEALIPELLHRRYAERLRVVRFTVPKLRMLRDASNWTLPLYFAWRIISLTLLLTVALFGQVKHTDPPVDVLLVQNPPAVPLLLLCALYGHFHKAALVIDWHNLGFSMISKQDWNFYRYLALVYERVMAPYAHGHLAVTQTLRNFVLTDMLGQSSVQPHQYNTAAEAHNMEVLHDCPPAHFRLRTLREQHAVLTALQPDFIKACPASWMDPVVNAPTKATLFTEEYGPNQFRPRHGRPALIVSSTSYTADEDIGLLIQAMQQLDERIEATGSQLQVLCLITGKGPLKEMYEEQIANIAWKNHVVVTTLWLEPTDYPTLLACADLGVSLHTSTSGMDLPIKILDYFGCEVPVCAYEFQCLKDLVQDDVNGRTFVTAPELATCLWTLLEPINEYRRGNNNKGAAPGNHDFGDLKRYSLQIQGRLLWSENWPKHAWPVIQRAAETYQNNNNNSNTHAKIE